MADGDLILDLETVKDMPWRLGERQGARMDRSGFSQVVVMAEPVWTFDLGTVWLDEDQYRQWDAWLVDRRGAASTFLAWRMSRPLPAAGGVVSDAGLTVSGYDRAASTVSFGATGAWTATKGDMLSYYTAQLGYWCGMAMETKAASGSAMTALKVYPPPFAPHATLAAPRRIKALAEFTLRLPLAQSIERVDERYVSFSADQLIRG